MDFQSFHQRNGNKNLFGQYLGRGSFVEPRCFSTKSENLLKMTDQIASVSVIATRAIVVGGFIGSKSQVGSTQRGSEVFICDIVEKITENILREPGETSARDPPPARTCNRNVSESSTDSDDSFIVFDDGCQDEDDTEEIDDDDDDDVSRDDDDTVIFQDLCDSSSVSEFSDFERFGCSLFSNDCISCDSGQSSRIEAANKAWNSFYSEPIVPEVTKSNSNNKKKVRFAEGKPSVRKIIVWDYAHRAARKGDWEMLGRDSGRFKRRIKELSAVLSPILSQEHRDKIFTDRFKT